MPDHIHLFKPGAAVTFRAETDIIGGRLVTVAAPRAVQHASAAAGTYALGAAAQDTPEGDDVLVLRGGVQNLIADGVIYPGSRVGPADDGKVRTVGGGEYSIGLALTGSSADGDLVQIALD